MVRAAPPGALPAGIERLPGPSLLVAARYREAPVGPYLELAVASPARIGARAGLCVTAMAVDSSESLSGGRSNWGFPKELSSLHWTARPDRWSLGADNLGLSVVASPRGPAVPVVAPVCCLQRRADGPVLVPGWLRGRARPARVEVSVDIEAADPLPALAGRHRGLVVAGLRLVISRARRAGDS